MIQVRKDVMQRCFPEEFDVIIGHSKEGTGQVIRQNNPASSQRNSCHSSRDWV